MQPWKISVGFTVIIIAIAGMLGGERFGYIEPHIPMVTFHALLDGPSVAWRAYHPHAHGRDLRSRPRFGLG